MYRRYLNHIFQKLTNLESILFLLDNFLYTILLNENLLNDYFFEIISFYS